MLKIFKPGKVSLHTAVHMHSPVGGSLSAKGFQCTTRLTEAGLDI